MGRLISRAAAFSALALLGAVSAANAQTFNFSYAGPGVTASGVFLTTPLATAGKYLITGLTGTRNGAAMTLIPGNPDGSPKQYFPPFGIITYDNVLTFPGTPLLNTNGLFFQTSDGLFNTYAAPYEEDRVQGGAAFLTSFTVTPAGSSVPEPGSVALFVGMAGVGADVLRKRRK